MSLRRIAWGAGAGLLFALVIGAAWLAWRSKDRPDLSEWRNGYELPAGGCARESRCVTARWLGVATLLISDGETALLTDGFLSRVSMLELLRDVPVAPDEAAIAAGLERAGIDRLDAVLVVHSHFDHALDAGVVALRTGAQLLGSASTANVGLGAGLTASRIVEVAPGVPYAFGDFEVRFRRSKHVPLPGGDSLAGEIAASLRPPAPPSAYKEGGSYSILVAHPLGTLLIQGSAGFLAGELEGVRADTVLLGIGGLAGQDEVYQSRYYDEIVARVGASRVIPIHWDDFTLAPGVVLPMPSLLDDVAASLGFLASRAEAGAELALLPPWQEAVLFEQP